MNQVVLGLGSNIGDRKKNLDKATKELLHNGCRLVKESSIYETEPWGNTNQPQFYNKVLEISTSLSPQELLSLILKIEIKLGRERNKKWSPRIIDIDILFFSDLIINEPNLNIPHSHLHERKFVLEPLNETVPDYIHPVLKKPIHQLLAELKDTSKVEKV